MRDRGRALLRGKGFSAFVTSRARPRVTQVETVTGRKSVPPARPSVRPRVGARSDTSRFYSIVRHARVRFFISYFFITCPRECVGGTGKYCRAIADRAKPSRGKKRIGSGDLGDEEVAVRPPKLRVRLSHGERARVSSRDSSPRPFEPVENFSAQPTAREGR